MPVPKMPGFGIFWKAGQESGKQIRMNLYLVRHGIAEDPADASLNGRSDPERRLTAFGLEQAAAVAAAFGRRVSSVGQIVHSPYVRARETAELFAKEVRAEVEEASAFRPGDDPVECSELVGELVGRSGSLLLVSHEPFLGRLASYLISGKFEVDLTFSQASVAALEWAGPGRSRLLFLAPRGFC
jgi:phosphohistidine phosphatase